MRRYVVVSGPPASGKSTIAPALAAELGWPLVAKDSIKDALLEALGCPDVEASRQLGAAAVRALLAVARDCPDGAVLESVWYRSRAADDLRALDAPIVEVFCRCDRAVASARYRARAGTRSAGHFDTVRTDDELWNPEVAEPIAGGWPVLEVRTDEAFDASVVVRLAEDADRLLHGPAGPGEAPLVDR